MKSIEKSAIDKFILPLEGQGAVGTISLFMVSTKDSSLKKLNLDKLSLEERREQLKAWGRENRFVLVIEKGDQLFAHVHNQYVQDLQRCEALSLGGRKVTVKALSDEEAAELSAIGEACEDLIAEEEEEKKEEKVERQNIYNYSSVYQRVFGKGAQVSTPTHFLVGQLVKHHLSQILIDCMKRFEEARRELEKQKEASDKKSEILKEEIKKEVFRGEVKKEEISRIELKKIL